MNLELKLNNLARKHNFEYTWEPMAYNARRAVIVVGSWNQLEYIRNVFKRVKNVRVDNWKCFDGDYFEGCVYVMDEEEYARYKAECDAERARHDDWWKRYHYADDETKRLMACGEIE